jgi:hypothetical protein
MPGKLKARLAKLEQQLSERVMRQELRKCNCPGITILLPNDVEHLEQFEAQVSLTCPVHGLRWPERLLVVNFVHMNKTLTEESVRLNQAVDVYHSRRLE